MNRAGTRYLEIRLKRKVAIGATLRLLDGRIEAAWQEQLEDADNLLTIDIRVAAATGIDFSIYVYEHRQSLPRNTFVEYFKFSSLELEQSELDLRELRRRFCPCSMLSSTSDFCFSLSLSSLCCATCERNNLPHAQVNGTVSLTGPGSYAALKVIYGDLNILFSSATPDGLLALDSLLFVSGSISITATQNARLGVQRLSISYDSHRRAQTKLGSRLDCLSLYHSLNQLSSSKYVAWL